MSEDLGEVKEYSFKVLVVGDVSVGLCIVVKISYHSSPYVRLIAVWLKCLDFLSDGDEAVHLTFV